MTPETALPDTTKLTLAPDPEPAVVVGILTTLPLVAFPTFCTTLVNKALALATNAPGVARLAVIEISTALPSTLTIMSEVFAGFLKAACAIGCSKAPTMAILQAMLCDPRALRFVIILTPTV